jgi:hypothetical protein
MPRSATRGYSNHVNGNSRAIAREFSYEGAAPTSKRHRCLIRTRAGACVAHLICERARATAADPIGVETVIPCRGDQRVVAINIDTIGSRAAPGQVRSASPVYQVATRSECDLTRRSRGRCSWSRCRCRCCGGSSCWCCGRCRCRRRCTYRLSIVKGILLGTAANSYASVYPCMEMLVRRGAGIVIVARISRLYPGIRLKR